LEIASRISATLFAEKSVPRACRLAAPFFAAAERFRAAALRVAAPFLAAADRFAAVDLAAGFRAEDDRFDLPLLRCCAIRIAPFGSL
jgi:hypothetical protein